MDRLDQLRDSVQHDSNDPVRLVTLAAEYFICGDPDQAIPILHLALDIDPSCVAAWEHLARCHRIAGRPQEATTAATQGLAIADEADDPIGRDLFRQFLSQGNEDQ